MGRTITQDIIHKLDRSNVYGSVLAFPDQVRDGFRQSARLPLPAEFGKVKEIVVTAMGGSALGARFMAALYRENLPVPFEIVNDYYLPGYVGPSTLVVADSYSGTTEETLAAYAAARKVGAQIFTITTGGTLKELSERDGTTCLTIQPRYNPSQQPRMGFGYPIGAIADLLSRLQLIDLNESRLEEACEAVKSSAVAFQLEAEKNEAVQLAEALLGRIPILIASGHLSGAVHATKNQLNENAKNFAVAFAIPELNHHLMEGLEFPATNAENLIFVFFESEIYQARIQKRFKLTKELTDKNGLKTHTYQARGKDKLEQALEVAQFGAFVNFYLALGNGVDPAPIPTVDWFKEQMG